MTPVEILNDEYKSIVEFLDANAQPSLSGDVNKYFIKVIILSSASYFEHLIQEILVDFISRETNNNAKAIHFFKRKAISMQYHTYFIWGKKDNPDKPGKNVNTFFALFGDDLKKSVDAEMKAEPRLKASADAFLEMGHLRNILIHRNFAAYNLDTKTTDDIFELYKAGLPFVEYIKTKLQQPAI